MSTVIRRTGKMQLQQMPVISFSPQISALGHKMPDEFADEELVLVSAIVEMASNRPNQANRVLAKKCNDWFLIQLGRYSLMESMSPSPLTRDGSRLMWKRSPSCFVSRETGMPNSPSSSFRWSHPRSASMRDAM